MGQGGGVLGRPFPMPPQDGCVVHPGKGGSLPDVITILHAHVVNYSAGQFQFTVSDLAVRFFQDTSDADMSLRNGYHQTVGCTLMGSGVGFAWLGCG